MAELDERLKKEIDALRTLRDELRVKLNLASKDARDAFESAEKTWRKLEGRIRLVGRESKKELNEIAEAARPLAQELKTAYHRIRDLI
ncbi:MAG TPA: hypothetical protein VMR86_09805 [Myxococcota bacterium]|nr:hypothetical protein [Myxococcota bacterium]